MRIDPRLTALADGYWARIRKRAAAIHAEVHERRVAGEIATMTEEERQAGERVRELYIEAGDPDIALLDTWLVGRLEVARRFDSGELAAEDVEPAMVAAAETANVAYYNRQIGEQAMRILAQTGDHVVERMHHEGI